MRSPPPKGKMLLIGSDDVEVYPQYCGDGHKCIQCWFNGKFLCAPRYWLYPTLDGYPGYPSEAKSIWGKSCVRLSATNRDGKTLESILVGQPLVEIPDGEMDRFINQISFARRDPYRITDARCKWCGYGFLTQIREELPRDNYRVIYECPQCGREQIEDNKVLLQIPDTVKPLLRELRGQGISVRITIERIQQELGIRISVYAYYQLARDMGLPLTRKFERGGTITVAQVEASKRNVLKTPSHRIKALREALVQ